MKKLLLIVTCLVAICLVGCIQLDSILSSPSNTGLSPGTSDNPTDQELINYSKAMVETTAPVNRILTYNPKFGITQDIDGRFFVSGDCKFINTDGKPKRARFICGIEIVDEMLTPFSFDWLEYIN